jgi:hypothetical protein
VAVSLSAVGFIGRGDRKAKTERSSSAKQESCFGESSLAKVLLQLTFERHGDGLLLSAVLDPAQ